MIKVFYHRADADGWFCREIAKRNFDSLMPKEPVGYIGWHYGDPVPPVSRNDELYMLDISIDELMGHPNLVWIDHHKSAIEQYSLTLRGVRIDGVAACRLAWQWFFGEFSAKLTKENFINREVDEPYAVRLAGEYDIWDHRDPAGKAFQFGLRSRDLTPADWNRLLDNNVHPILRGTGMDQTESELLTSALCQTGWILLSNAEKENALHIKNNGFELQFEGLRFLACNSSRLGSAIFDSAVKPEHEALFVFRFDGKFFQCSMYHVPHRTDIDLSLIAKKYGGGGHRGACGFRMKYLAFAQIIGKNIEL